MFLLYSYYFQCNNVNTLQLVLKKLHQTPEKFIYVFNLCHISFIINGMTRILPSAFTTTESFVRVWRNEFTRVICDRLTYQQVLYKFYFYSTF